MPKVNFVKHARKDYPDHEIKKGESYYWWKFNFNPYKHFSKTYPKHSQLPQSDFSAQVYDIEDRIEGLSADLPIDETQSEVESIIEAIRSLGEEQQEKLDNMPEQLRESSSSGEMLQNRVERCENWASNLESVDLNICEPEGGTKEEHEEFEQAKQDLIDELQGYSYEGE